MILAERAARVHSGGRFAALARENCDRPRKGGRRSLERYALNAHLRLEIDKLTGAHYSEPLGTQGASAVAD
jgi:hypothetical protein